MMTGSRTHAITPGAVVWYYTDRVGYRTGVYLRTIERGKRFGLCVVRDSVSGRSVSVSADALEPIKPKGV